ncbi:glycosyltransferase family 2 protein [Chryseobacterium salivictor]|uniref:Hyaluronan synthase n=1 Tax=Chryseobacterium salivictor TaxID=2547600 RepID=A0A4P6ZFG0_9FLAO|nr:glycosyltransferase family 2 protein [Chryseobacterium salivictor]QBO58353.1 Hyaluronan synthase [Chryseobacterium salivictor]
MPPPVAVSIIIPNYNHALYLKQRIDSVLQQTFQDFELIILDDCSTDNSRQIIEEYRTHPKVSKMVYNEQNSGGVFKQWIKGIENAKGEYIWIAESDDYADENFLQQTLKVIEKDDFIGMVFTNTNTVNSEGEFRWTTEENKSNCYAELATLDNTINKDNASQFLVSEMIIANASSVLFRKSSLVAINFEELKKFVNTGDRFVYLGIALQSNIVYISKPLNFMRSHEHNTTKKSFENGNIHKDRLRVLNYYFNDLCATELNCRNVVAFYKTNYLSFIHYGDYYDNAALLKKLKERNEIQNSFYHVVMFNLFLFRKANINSRILKGLYYRILVRQNSL